MINDSGEKEAVPLLEAVCSCTLVFGAEKKSKTVRKKRVVGHGEEQKGRNEKKKRMKTSGLCFDDFRGGLPYCNEYLKGR